MLLYHLFFCCVFVELRVVCDEYNALGPELLATLVLLDRAEVHDDPAGAITLDAFLQVSEWMVGLAALLYVNEGAALVAELEHYEAPLTLEHVKELIPAAFRYV